MGALSNLYRGRNDVDFPKLFRPVFTASMIAFATAGPAGPMGPMPPSIPFVPSLPLNPRGMLKTR